MSDTAVALVVVPLMVLVVVAVECSRIGCTRVSRYVRTTRNRAQAQLEMDATTPVGE